MLMIDSLDGVVRSLTRLSELIEHALRVPFSSKRGEVLKYQEDTKKYIE